MRYVVGPCLLRRAVLTIRICTSNVFVIHQLLERVVEKVSDSKCELSHSRNVVETCA